MVRCMPNRKATGRTKADMVEVDGVLVGLSISADMRFPAMYRALARAGAQVLSVPSALPK